MQLPQFYKIKDNGDIQQQNSITNKNIIIDLIGYFTFPDGSFTHLEVCVFTYLAGDCAIFDLLHDNHIVYCLRLPQTFLQLYLCLSFSICLSSFLFHHTYSTVKK